MADPFAGVPGVHGWVPIDHASPPLSLHPWLSNGHTAIAMSQHGQNALSALSEGWRAHGQQPFDVAYAPHAVDDVFMPSPSDFRERASIPADAFLVGIVAANNGTKVYDRKGFGDMAHALGYFMSVHPDVYLYVHSLARSFDGMELDILFQYKGLPPDRVVFADQYEYRKQTITDEEMARRYSAMDVLLLTSRGEGFGLPGIEAQACGVPVILSNWTAQAELVGEPWDRERMGYERHPSGWLVPVEPDYDPRQGGCDWGKPRIPAILKALEEAYEARGDQTMRAAALARAELYRADAVFDRHWRPILERMEQQSQPVPINRAQRRAALRAKAKSA
jgi:glycosyltransferase involved in cell wall biosynthesis